jgi:archaellum component FlaC
MKKLAIFFLTALLITSISSSTSAKVATPPGQDKKIEVQEKLEEKKQKILEKRETIRERIEEKKASIAARLEERRKVRIRAYWQQLNTRLLAVVNRLRVLIDRIESRLAKIEDENEELKVEIDDIYDQVDVAKETLNETEIDIQAATESMELVLASDNPKQAFEEIRAIIKEAKENLVDVHRTLVHVIGDIKGLRVGTSENGSETSEATESASP